MKNYQMANKGKGLENEVKLANKQYQNREMALIQKISTPWVVVRRGKQIVKAFPEGQSTLDFRGTAKGGTSISFDCKETKDPRGLPLSNILPHQVDYMRTALKMGEFSFILCYLQKQDKRYFIHGRTILNYWDYWQANKGKRGINFIPVMHMREVKQGDGIVLDYLQVLKGGPNEQSI